MVCATCGAVMPKVTGMGTDPSVTPTPLPSNWTDVAGSAAGGGTVTATAPSSATRFP